MAKSITISEIRDALREALKPIMDDIAYLKQRGNTNDTQITEMHRNINAISIKLDTVDQTVSVAQKPPVKRAPKKKSDAKEASNESETGVPEANDAESVCDPEDLEDSEVSSVVSEDKKAKKPVKRATSSSSSGTKKTGFNKLVQFRKAFAADEKSVLQNVPADTVTEINESVTSLRGTAKNTQRVKAFYEYINKNKPEFFAELKRKFDAS